MVRNKSKKPNKIVKLVLEQVDDESGDMAGCRVYLETQHRDITEKVLASSDCTPPETWGAEIYRGVKKAFEEQCTCTNCVPVVRKEDMN